MKLKSFRYLISLFVILMYTPLLGEEKIDIWKNKKENSNEIRKITKKKSNKLGFTTKITFAIYNRFSKLFVYEKQKQRRENERTNIKRKKKIVRRIKNSF